MGCSTTCKTKGCGSSSGGCSSGVCGKMDVFDWFSYLDMPQIQSFPFVEIKFKSGRKDFYSNSISDLFTGDAVCVDTGSGFHVGFVSLQGELVRLQMKKKNIVPTTIVQNVIRKATSKDLERYREAQLRELPSLYRTRNIIIEQKLKMKLSDVEYQTDMSKATFFYSAEDRVDFRDLIKVLAGEFKVKVEMRQINLRQEAGRLGGIGVCGRELCCSTWLNDFKNVNTSAARYQNLSLNPIKLAGQCGRLKCCLNYELDTYMDALKGIPEVEKPLITKKGKAFLQKTDIFRRKMWFSYAGEVEWVAMEVNQVIDLIEKNKNGITPFDLLNDEEPKNLDFNRAVINSGGDLQLSDKKFFKKKEFKKFDKR